MRRKRVCSAYQQVKPSKQKLFCTRRRIEDGLNQKKILKSWHTLRVQMEGIKHISTTLVAPQEDVRGQCHGTKNWLDCRGSFPLTGSCVDLMQLSRKMQKVGGLIQNVKDLSLSGFEFSWISRIKNDNFQGGSFFLI